MNTRYDSLLKYLAVLLVNAFCNQNSNEIMIFFFSETVGNDEEICCKCFKIVQVGTLGDFRAPGIC